MQSRSNPQAVKGPDGQPFKATQISAGSTDSAAIDLNGRVYVWGSETNDKSTYSTLKLTPALAKDPSRTFKARMISMGNLHALAIGQDGTVWAWGWNSAGEIGDGTQTDRSTPT